MTITEEESIRIMTEELHPNWAALATIKFKYKKFVKASEQDSNVKPDSVGSSSHKCDGNGDNIKSFYDDVISNELLKRKKIKREKSHCKVETIDISDDEEDVQFVDTNANRKLLLYIQNEDFESVKSLHQCDYNFKDEYGWTPLEIAAVTGNCNIVRYLIDKGAEVNNHEKLWSILMEKKLSSVMEILSPTTKDHIDLSNEEVLLEACTSCGEMFDKNNEAAHRATITHQLSIQSEDDNCKKNPGFQIAESNVGFKMMKRSGWDGASGLGDECQGKLFPVKTTFKHDRKGLEVGDRKNMRITHFGPRNVESVANRRQRKPFNVKKPKQLKVLRRGSKHIKVDITKDQVIREDMGDL